MNKLQIVTDKICELLNSTNLDPLRNVCEIRKVVSPRPIREAEVLMALRVAPVDTEYALDEDGDFLKREYEGWICAHGNKTWQLGKPLSEQSPETIEFLYNVLNCEG